MKAGEYLLYLLISRFSQSPFTAFHIPLPQTQMPTFNSRVIFVHEMALDKLDRQGRFTHTFMVVMVMPCLG